MVASRVPSEGRQPGGERDGDGRKDDVETDDEGELDAREQYGVEIHVRLPLQMRRRLEIIILALVALGAAAVGAGITSSLADETGVEVGSAPDRHLVVGDRKQPGNKFTLRIICRHPPMKGQQASA